ncbi:MAG: hypothetical protein SFZ23_12680 [Planctomycetota bacterium]|nr:hypothetical protein [Planctomycetota bacterium]
MKLKIRVDGKMYEVEVEAAEGPAAPSAASRVEGSPITGSLPKHPASRSPIPGKLAAPSTATSGVTSTPPTSVPTTSASEPSTPAAPREPWHGLTVGEPGECLAPLDGTVLHVLVKVGDAIRENDPLLELQVGSTITQGANSLVGTLRSVAAGVISDVTVKAGDQVRIGQVLMRTRKAAATP